MNGSVVMTVMRSENESVSAETAMDGAAHVGLKTALVRKISPVAGSAAGGAETIEDRDEEDGFSSSLEMGRGFRAGEPRKASWLRARHGSLLRSASGAG